MASSDDEDEMLPVEVSDYCFVDNNDEPISFSELNLMWDDVECLGGRVEKIGLHAAADNGLKKVFEQIIAWKFDLSSLKPVIFVLTQKKKWIKLLKPRKSFEETIKSVLITVHCLHFLKRNPDTTGKALWDYLSKSFSLYEPRPSENDLADHFDLISEAVKRDDILSKSQVLIKFLEDKPKKKKVSVEEFESKAVSGFIIDDDVIKEEEVGSDNEVEDFYEHVCAICDNGGDILPCEGICLRSFHATEAAGAESECESLGFSDQQLKAISTFECKNCLYKQHQCYCCGKLGSSDKLAGAEVFQCRVGTCGYFYHPNCVAEAFQLMHGDESRDRQSEIAAAKSITCPLHFCFKCKETEPENDNDLQLQFAVCRRCPKAYHRKCLPRDIAFEADENRHIAQRAWEDLIPKKILIYCLEHEIDDELETPLRDHIIFPGIPQKKKKPTPETDNGLITLPKKRPYSPEGYKKTGVTKALKGHERFAVSSKSDNLFKRKGQSLVPDSSRKPKLLNKSKVALKKEDKDSATDHEPSVGERLFEFYKDLEPINLKKGENSSLKDQTRREKPVTEEKDDYMILDDDSRKRINSIIKETEAAIGLDHVKRNHRAPSKHYDSTNAGSQNMTMGKIEGLVEAIRAALQKLETGGSLQDAKALCRPVLLNEIVRWKSKLRVYLAPFLYGTRYTSFGRHFTKVDKLQAIVNKLHCYVEEGDMIVDFCCGANDFSCLMKKKLDEVGKNCSYKNFDIYQAKNDFNFEKKDWMTVGKRDLPEGKNLIMGLNPPFGVNAALANKFIDKALEFKPKLIILIVPPETERLDRKKPPYDLVWEDHDLLTGKAFYLPGSVGASDKQLDDWNVTAPPLSLWSRQDWTAKHMAIARKSGHLSCADKAIQSNKIDYDKDTATFVSQAHELGQQSSVLSGADDATQDVMQRQVANMNTDVDDHGSSIDVKETPNNNDPGKEKQKNTLEHGNKVYRKRRRETEERSAEEGSVQRHSSLSNPDDRSSSSPLAKPPEKSSRNKSPAEEQRKGQGNVMPESAACKPGDRLEISSLEKPPAKLSHNKSRAEERRKEEGSVIPESRSMGSRKRHRGSEEKSSQGRSVPSSPSMSGGRSAGLPRPPAMLSHNEVHTEGYHHFDRESRSGSQPPFYKGQIDSEVDLLARKYNRGQEGYQSHGLHRGDSNEDYRLEHLRAQIALHGRQGPEPLHERDNYGVASPRFAPSYGHLRPGVGSSAYSSTMQRYAPRLDELNPRRISDPMVSNIQSTSGLPYHSVLRGRTGNDSMGFAPGPYRPYSHHSSPGWLNE